MVSKPHLLICLDCQTAQEYASSWDTICKAVIRPAPSQAGGVPKLQIVLLCGFLHGISASLLQPVCLRALQSQNWITFTLQCNGNTSLQCLISVSGAMSAVQSTVQQSTLHLSTLCTCKYSLQHNVLVASKVCWLKK